MRRFSLSLVVFPALFLLIFSLAVLGGTAAAVVEGDSNNFFGDGAGSSNTGSNNNSFFGANAGAANTIGIDNSFFGAHAGFSNSEGYYNSFFGRFAGFANTIGGGNSFFGRRAGHGNTTGGTNSFFGEDAGYANNGSQNSFFGFAAGNWNTTGYYNSFFGSQAGYNNSGGYNNSFFGQEAGISNTVENCNTFVGYRADLNRGTDSVTNATSIGYRAYVAQSNSLVLGSIAGVNGATANVNVGIGTSTPARQLHIKGDNAVFRMDRSTDTAAFMLVRTDAGGAPQKTFVVGTNASGADTGEFVINDLGTAVAGGGTRRMTITNNGAVDFPGIVTAPQVIEMSSLAFKTNVRTYENALETVKRLRGVHFDWKESGKPSVGLIAEEVEGVVPEVVAHAGNSGAATGVNYSGLIGVLVEAVKEQQAAMTKQEERISKQEEAISQLMAEVNRLKSKDMIAQR